MIFYVIYGILIFAWVSCFLVAILQGIKLVKLQKYTRIDAKITRAVRESWSGDTADRAGGVYDFPVAEFWEASQGSLAFVLREVEHLDYKPGQTISMAYPPDDPQQAIVFDAGEMRLTLALYMVLCLVLSFLIIAFYLWTTSALN